MTRAAVDVARRTATAQGVPERVQDPAVLAKVAALLDIENRPKTQ